MSVYSGPDIITDGLILYLDAANQKSYPGTGTTWFDLSNNTNFTISGPDFVSTKPQHFSFSDNQVDQIYKSSYSGFSGLSQLTCSVWVKFDSASLGCSLISYAVTGSDNEYLLFYGGADSPKRFHLWFDGTQLLVNYTITAGTWYNLTNVVNATQNILYINGAVFSTLTKTGTSLAGGGYCVFGQEQDSVGGGFATDQELVGDLNQVMIYNLALSSDDVLQNYLATKSRYGL
jgi:hypothetical protein